MIRVGVLRGGTSNKYDESLASGAYVLAHFPRDRYQAVDIFIDRAGVWHIAGAPISYDRLARAVDVIWNTLHGFYGEDGKVAQLLENLGIPYVGSGPLSAAIAMNKKLAKERFAELGAKTPRGIYIEAWGSGEREDAVLGAAAQISQKLSPPWIIEPIARGQSSGVIKANTRNELAAVLFEMFDLGLPVLVEEAVLGREVSVISLPGFRGQASYTFIPMHADAPKLKMRAGESDQLQKLSEMIHEKLHLGGYSRMRAIITPKGALYVLGVDTMPELHAHSNLHQSLAAVGSSFDEFARHMIDGAMERK